MAKSMTGFGAGRASADGLSVVVELRSVNNRFLDFNIRTPRALYSKESEIRKIINSKFSRGRISVFVCEEWSDDRGPNITVDRARANLYADRLAKINQELNLPGEVRLEHILSVDNIFKPADDEEYRTRVWKLTREALTIATDNLLESASAEGLVLCDDISGRIDSLTEFLEQIKTLAANQSATYATRLHERIAELTEDDRFDATRLEMEVAVAADKLDITEEIVRLESHIGMFRKTLKKEEAIGKSLGFIVQEMVRETNTIASKSWAVEISQTAIQMKEVIEQIREQLQNIE